MNKWIIKHITNPLWETLAGRKRLKYLKELEESQYWPRKKLQELQNKRLRALIKHAYENIPFYKKLYNKYKVKPSDLKEIKDIRKFPIVTKEMLKKAGKDILAKNIPESRWKKSTTSGSTAEPFLVYSDKELLPIEYAAWLRDLQEVGYKLGDKIVKIRGYKPKKIPFLRKVINRFLYLSSLEVETKIDWAIKKIKKFKPQILESYANTTFTIAKQLVQNNDTIKLKGILIIGCPLSKYQKKILRKAFGNPKICLNYGSAELMHVAYQCCLEDKYHIDITRFVVELIKNKKPVRKNEEGEMVITNLDNYVMPLIRYSTRDSAIYGSGKCSCKRTFPTIQDIKGRIVDNVITKDGKLIRVGEFILIFSQDYEYVDRYQIIKESDEKLTINVQPSKKMNDKKFKEIIGKIRKICDGKIAFEVHLVDKISLAPSGKAVLVRNQSSFEYGDPS